MYFVVDIQMCGDDGLCVFESIEINTHLIHIARAKGSYGKSVMNGLGGKADYYCYVSEKFKISKFG